MAVAKRDSKGHFLPGSTANPHGRPPRQFSVTTAFAELMQGHPVTVSEKWKKEQGGKLTGAQQTALAAFGSVTDSQANSGQILKEMLNRVEGRVPMPVEHSGPDGQGLPTAFTIHVVDKKAKKLTQDILDGKGTE